MKYIMRAIQTQGLQGDVAGKLHNLVQTYESSFNTGNPALDIILGDAEKNFRSKGIKFECFTDACDLSFMENFDFIRFWEMLSIMRRNILIPLTKKSDM